MIAISVVGTLNLISVLSVNNNRINQKILKFYFKKKMRKIYNRQYLLPSLIK